MIKFNTKVLGRIVTKKTKNAKKSLVYFFWLWYDNKVDEYNNLEVEIAMVKTILLVLHVIVCLSLILIVILQSGRSAGISGEIAGGAETFFGKNKARTLNGMLGRWTTYAAIIFVITSLALTILWNA